MNFLKSNPSKILVVLSILTIVCTIIVPIVLTGVAGFNFVTLPAVYYLYVVALVLLYALIVQIVKRRYIKKYNEWL